MTPDAIDRLAKRIWFEGPELCRKARVKLEPGEREFWPHEVPKWISGELHRFFLSDEFKAMQQEKANY